MSLTITNKNVPILPAAGLRLVFSTIDFDSSYPTGGEAVTAANFGLSTILAIIPAGTDDSANAYRMSFDKTNSKLLVYSQGAADAGDEVANTTDLSALEFYALVLGY